MSVDLPAPFSPSSPTISPGLISKSTCSSAWTPGKCLETFSIFNKGWFSMGFISLVDKGGRWRTENLWDILTRNFTGKERGPSPGWEGTPACEVYCDGMPMEFRYSLYRS